MAYTMVIKCIAFRALFLIWLSGEYRILLGSVGTMGVTLHGIDKFLCNITSIALSWFNFLIHMFAWRHQGADWTSTLGRD